ncbi:LytR/AlgR family response regulator transcription factor [Pseudoduganella plicata]|uniref:DNA-binding response regulator n=1 Tax=Pseudoduganella plicata TaxID=321984 RepID=A0A4P7BJR6_9BURK|nr:LytTR family DNA-binding domain-containing protein [Pseudoduganella plicata]QBQ39171.1 response regulator transcription factor [Pseudoduganella plicata]GGY87927.1 DNA-binding response regulator [Pseudoduganella plicata]
MKTIIVDDEPLARGIVREYLAAHADVKIVAECGNGFEAVKAIAELAPDLVILDIQMPRLDGFEVLELVGARNGPRFIFATAFDNFAIRAFEVRALDYLLKPFSQQRFARALDNARTAAPAAALESLGRAAALRERAVERVLIRDGANVHVIACGRIDCVQAQDDYVEIRAEGRAYLKNQPLSELESQLDPQRFLRIHRSWLVNIEAVSRIEQATRDSHVAVLKDGSRVPVSRSGYQKLRAAMG